MIGIYETDWIEIVISDDGTQLWINSKGGCLLRAYRIKKLILVDNREKVSDVPER